VHQSGSRAGKLMKLLFLCWRSKVMILYTHLEVKVQAGWIIGSRLEFRQAGWRINTHWRSKFRQAGEVSTLLGIQGSGSQVEVSTKSRFRQANGILGLKSRNEVGYPTLNTSAMILRVLTRSGEF